MRRASSPLSSTYVPASDRLTLNVNSAEPAGGLFAHFANLPGLPPAKLAFNGAGTLDNFTAKLDFAAGADIWAKGAGRRRPAGRRAAAHARPDLATRGPCARRHPPDLRRRDDAQGRRSFQRQFEHCPSRRPACRFGQRPARLRGRQVGRQSARSQGPRRRDSGRDDDRKARSQRLDRRDPFPARRSKPPSTPGKSVSPKDRSTMSPRHSAPPRTAP